MSKKVHINEDKVKSLFGCHFDSSRKMFFPKADFGLDKPWTYADYRLTEGLIKTYPFESMEKHICDYMNIPSYYFHKIENNGINRAAIDIPLERCGMKDSIERCMSTFGYFLSKEIKYDDFVRQIYEPKFQYDKVKTEDGDFLYHITPLSNLNKIMLMGLKPSSNNIVFGYPERIFLLSKDASYEYLTQTAYMLKETHKKPKNKHGKYQKMPSNLYAIIKIFLNKLPNNIEFHKDVNYEPYGLYTTSNIPPNAIDLDKIINLNKL